MTLGEFLRKKRKELKMTALELSLRIKISRSYITLMEIDKLDAKPSEELMNKLEKALCLNEEEKEIFYGLYDEAELPKRIKDKIKSLEKEIKALKKGKEIKAKKEPRIISFLGNRGTGVTSTIQRIANFFNSTLAYEHQLLKKINILIIDFSNDLFFTNERIHMTRNGTKGNSQDIISRSKTISEVLLGEKDINFSILTTPSSHNYDLILGNDSLTSNSLWNFEFNKEKLLKNVLKKIEKEYDYIFIDCHSYSSTKTINAFHASEHIIICFNSEKEEKKNVLEIFNFLKKEPFLETGKFHTLYINSSNSKENIGEENIYANFRRMKTKMLYCEDFEDIEYLENVEELIAEICEWNKEDKK